MESSLFGNVRKKTNITGLICLVVLKAKLLFDFFIFPHLLGIIFLEFIKRFNLTRQAGLLS